jgi:RNA polymerase sigma-70 factor (ECF subfamily)
MMTNMKYEANARADLGMDIPASELFPIIYNELRGLAHAWFAKLPKCQTLQPTAVVHEAFIRLARSEGANWEDSAHFRAVAARAMRQVLADYAKRKRASKRGPQHKTMSLCEADAAGAPSLDAAPLAFDESLRSLARLNARQATIVEMKFLGGLSCEEIARLMELSKRTVELDWKMARAWLADDLSTQERG